MNKRIDLNAKQALEEMKLEIADDLDVKLADVGTVGGMMTRRLVEMGEKQLAREDDFDTFNPS